jgi:hypothetical protein
MHAEGVGGNDQELASERLSQGGCTLAEGCVLRESRIESPQTGIFDTHFRHNPSNDFLTTSST